MEQSEKTPQDDGTSTAMPSSKDLEGSFNGLQQTKTSPVNVNLCNKYSSVVKELNLRKPPSSPEKDQPITTDTETGAEDPRFKSTNDGATGTPLTEQSNTEQEQNQASRLSLESFNKYSSIIEKLWQTRTPHSTDDGEDDHQVQKMTCSTTFPKNPEISYTLESCGAEKYNSRVETATEESEDLDDSVNGLEKTKVLPTNENNCNKYPSVMKKLSRKPPSIPEKNELTKTYTETGAEASDFKSLNDETSAIPLTEQLKTGRQQNQASRVNVNTFNKYSSVIGDLKKCHLPHSTNYGENDHQAETAANDGRVSEIPLNEQLKTGQAPNEASRVSFNTFDNYLSVIGELRENRTVDGTNDEDDHQTQTTACPTTLHKPPESSYSTLEGREVQKGDFADVKTATKVPLCMERCEKEHSAWQRNVFEQTVLQDVKVEVKQTSTEDFPLCMKKQVKESSDVTSFNATSIAKASERRNKLDPKSTLRQQQPVQATPVATQLESDFADETKNEQIPMNAGDSQDRSFSNTDELKNDVGLFSTIVVPRSGTGLIDGTIKDTVLNNMEKTAHGNVAEEPGLLETGRAVMDTKTSLDDESEKLVELDLHSPFKSQGESISNVQPCEDTTVKSQTMTRKEIPDLNKQGENKVESSAVTCRTRPVPKPRPRSMPPSTLNKLPFGDLPRKKTSTKCEEPQSKDDAVIETNKMLNRPTPKRRSRAKQPVIFPERVQHGEKETKLADTSADEGQVRTFGSQRELIPARSVYESKRVLVSGLNESTTRDALCNYMELMASRDVEEVEFLGQGKAVVDTSEPPDFEAIIKNVSSRKLDGMQLSVERINACNRVLVSGLSAQTTKDAILLYFENVRRSGGGHVKDVELRNESNCAVVRFEDCQVINNVVHRKHVLEGKQLLVEKYYPEISAKEFQKLSSGTTFSVDLRNKEDNEKSTDRHLSSNRQNTECEVEADIMELIMSGNHRLDFEKRLNASCKAEFNWSPGSNSVIILKKANTGYMKKWSKSCQKTVYEFLDRFEKFTVPVADFVVPVLRDTMVRLTADLPEGKALCKLHDTKQELLVVCLEDDKEAVLKSLEKVLKAIEKEEIHKTYKKEKVTGISYEHILLLEQIGFVKETKSKYAELEVILNNEKRELHFEGPRDQVSDSKIKCYLVINAIQEKTFDLPSTILRNILKKEPARKYVETKFFQMNINARIFPEPGNGVKIVAANSTALQRATHCLCESLKQDSVSFQKENTFIFESDKCKKLFKDLQDGELLSISVEKFAETVGLSGVTEAVESAKKIIQDLIEVDCIRKQRRSLCKGLIRFLDEQFPQELKDIENKLKDSHVSITIDKSNEVLAMSGSQEGLRKCNEYLESLLTTVVKESKEYSSPGLAKLLLADKGQRNVKIIEIEKKVVIEVRKKVKDGVRNTTQAEVDPTERERRNLAKMKDSFPSTGCIYDSCNFTTAEGLKVSWKHGRIEKEKADILVISATSDLNKLTNCGKALGFLGGQRFYEACLPHTNVPTGDVVCTSSGNLPCMFVMHVVCCTWDNGKGPAEQVLRCIVKKMLEKCIELRATSIAIPTIGTGRHGFPETVFFKLLKEEIESFSATHSSQNPLRVIRVIVFDTTPNSGVNATLIKQPEQQLQQPTITPSANSHTVSFGLVRVFLHEGDVTQQPPSVDAIINVLPTNLQLSNGGGVCKSILKAGGKAIQNQLDKIGRKQPGSVFSTSAGSIRNANRILHFLPTSTDVHGLQRAIEDCLKEATLQGLHSIAISAIGTAAFKISPRDSAKLISNAARSFSSANHNLDVNVVVFQQSMIPDFKKVLQEHARENNQQENIPQVAQSPCFIPPPPQNVAQPQRNLPGIVSGNTLRAGAAKETIVFDMFASSQNEASASFDEIDKFIKEHTVTKAIEQEKVFDVLVKHWPKVEKLARDHDVSISCSKSSSAADIQGMVIDVSDCKDELLQLVNSHAEEKRKSSQMDFISKSVQWYYFQGGQSVPYGKDLNAIIEMAHVENKGVFEITKNSERYEIDLSAKTETHRRTGQVETITRKQVGDSSSDITVPSHWVHQPSTQVVQLVSLQTLSPEYQQVLNHFTSRGGVSSQIIKIERIQNPGLYKAYLVKKQSMNGAENEQQLFHGTKADNVVSINANNFNRSYAGINGVKYGNGVYFARDASYSLRYSQAGNSGYSTMYVARVLVGKYTQGHQGMKSPPSRNDPNNPGLLFDSVVDNTSNPSIIVIFLDHQCYPEYLITFT